MQKTLTVVLLLVCLTGCSWMRKSGKSGSAPKTPPKKTAAKTTPAFALPGVPMANNQPVEPAEEKKTETAAAPSGEARPAEAAAASGKDLEFHLDAAGKHSARKRYRSAAAEYGAAIAFLPAGDARAVHLLERQGAMLLRAGNMPKAQEHFLAAIEKAKELNSSGSDLADSYLGLGYCQEKEAKIQEAISSYEKALELSAGKTVKARIANTISDLKKTAK